MVKHNDIILHNNHITLPKYTQHYTHTFTIHVTTQQNKHDAVPLKQAIEQHTTQ